MAVRQIVDIFEAIVERLDYTIAIDSVIDNGDGTYTINCENTYYCTKLNTITIDGFDYRIDNFIFNESITVSPVNHSNNPLLSTEIYLSAPTFFFGTVNSTDREITRAISLGLNDYPIVYFNEILREKFVSDPLSNVERIAPIRIFFLDIANYSDNLNKDFLDDVLKPLSNIEAKFYDELKKDANIGRINTDWDRINIPRFARTGENGETELIFSEELSGLELSIQIPIKKDCEC